MYQDARVGRSVSFTLGAVDEFSRLGVPAVVVCEGYVGPVDGADAQVRPMPPP